MDVVSSVLSIAQGVRIVIEAVKDEKKLAKSAQQLSHSCQMYVECLNSILIAINNHTAGGKKPSSEMQRFLENISTQVKMDQPLLEEIAAECHSISNSKANYGFVQNLVLSMMNKRMETLKVLENSLALRTQTLTTLMLQDVWRTTNGLDEEFISFVGDLEAASFWNGNFGTTKQIALRSFIEAYQKYICDTYNYRLLGQMQMLTLLRYTILEDAQGGSSNAILLNTEIALSTFATWIKRYGPMRDTLFKCAAVSHPETGQPAKWFHRQMTRDHTVQYIENNLRSYGAAIQADHMFVVRHSSDPRNHFVISVKSPVTQNIEHFAVSNSAMGYSLAGEEQIFSLTLLDCVQNYIFDKLFATATGQKFILSRDGVDAWDAVFLSAVESRVYEDSASFKSTVQQLPAGEKAAFGSLFTTSGGAAAGTDGPARPVGHGSSSAGHTVSEQKVIGSYLVEQGLQLLLQAGELNPVELEKVRQIIYKA